MFRMLFISFTVLSVVTIVEAQVKHQRTTKSLEDLAIYYEDERNAMIAVTEPDYSSYLLTDDFYEEIDNRPGLDHSMNMIFFGQPASFMRLDIETLLHILQYTQKSKIPIARTILAWDMVTDGKTCAFLQGREFLAFGHLLNVIPEEDLYYVNFGDKSVINYFANHYTKLQKRKVGILVASYKRYYGNSWYKNGTFIDDLGYLMCGFPSYDLARITPVVFRDISVGTFEKLKLCTLNQTRTLYNIATHRDAYGDPYRWSSYEVTRIGMLLTCIPTHMISSIQLEAVSAITANVMKEMDQNKLEHFTRPQIMRMSPQTRRIFIIRMQLRGSVDVLGENAYGVK